MHTNDPDRSAYMKQVRDSFHISEDTSSSRSFTRQHFSSQEEPETLDLKPYWKIRLLVGILCLIGFFILHQTGYQNQHIFEAAIVKQVQKNYPIQNAKETFSEVKKFLKK